MTHYDRSPSSYKPELLPPAESFYRANIAKFRARGRRATGLCPFHKDKNPSLSLDLDRGLFNCFSCGTAGGDVVDFVMQRDGIGFKEACQRLGCWEHGTLPKRRLTTKPVQYLVLDFAIDGQPHRAEADDTPRNDRQLTWRLLCDARERLAELRNGAAERFDGEDDTQWSILADSWELLNMEDR